MRRIYYLVILVSILMCVSPLKADYKFRIDHTCTDLSEIPVSAITQAKSTLHIVYQHTSHGSQLITGMDSLASYPDFGSQYQWSDDGSIGLDIDDYGIPGEVEDLSQGDYLDVHNVTPWVTATRALLDDEVNKHINVVLWSWCSINGHDIQRYITNMELLISEYGIEGSKVTASRPPVEFVFMTGHAEGEGEDLTINSVHYNNELIRNHCRQYNRVLFDFADIEAYNPGNPSTPTNPGYQYFWDQGMYDNLNYAQGNWAEEWLIQYPESELAKLTLGKGISGYDGCSDCAHSDNPDSANLNCILKGKAAWWLWASLAGWESSQPNYAYYIPVFKPPPGYWDGLGLANLSNTSSTDVTATIYNTSGAVLVSESKTIPASGQTNFVIGHILTQNGWIKITSGQKLAGLNFLGRYSDKNYCLADVPFTDQLSTLLIFPHIAQNTNWDTTFYVANPSASSATVIFTYRNANGLASTPYMITIPSNGCMEISANTVTQSTSIRGGTIRISSMNRIVAYALFNNLKTGNYSYTGIYATDISE